MTSPVWLKSIRLVNYKGFENHLVSLRRSNILVGANNAGKSTVLGALRLVVAMLPRARRVQPNEIGPLFGRQTRGWLLTGAAIEAAAFSGDNIRFDFRPVESRIEVTLSDGTRLVVAWADITDEDVDEPASPGMLFIIPRDGFGSNHRAAMREIVPEMAVVPTLTPLEQRESYVGDDSVKRHQTAKSSSRYFRNSLHRLLPTEMAEYVAYVCAHTPEIKGLALRRSISAQIDEFDLFFEEGSARHEREIAWVGDGIQIWLQVLFHLWRQRDAPILILDEPDVFLHPDLQRRLARLLFGEDRQIIVATHSIEILAEAEPGSAVWVDRSRRSAERPRADGALSLLGRRLGSGFELGVGRALRSSTVLFVEGDDAPILANLARQIDSLSVARSDTYATVPLGGFSQNWRASAFSETMSSLGNQVQTFVILDGDLRSVGAVNEEKARIEAAGAEVHVWRRRELENYLLNVSAISRASRMPRQAVTELFWEIIEQNRSEAFRTLSTQRLEEKRLNISGAGSLSNKTILERAESEFDDLWRTQDGKVSLVDAKLVIRSLNAEFQRLRHKTINAHSLSKNCQADEVPEELREVLNSLEQMIVRGRA